jgi:ABC-type uncharacterized transport system permease subunit
MESGHHGGLSAGLLDLLRLQKLVLNGLLDAITEHDCYLVNLKVIGEGLVNVRVVNIDGVLAGFHFKQVERNHLLPIVAGSLVLKEPLLLVLLAVEQRINLELFTLDLVGDLITMVKLDQFRLLIAYVHLEQLLGLGLDAEQVCLL